VQGPAAESWRRTLLQVPTCFGRLVYVARMRDAGSGRYVYRPLIDIVGLDVTDRTLANSHHSIFAEWIAFPLERQKADLDQYLRTSRGPADPDAYRDIMPATAHEVERQLYLTDLETLLALLRFEYGGVFAAPGA
jgi:hypothetical protein